ncbi:MAG: (2Fe-2S)-binding protein [Chloroflexi bacterium]|nr:(2Fe-2S)-binding protein [Chloroflexota bacterium]
MTKHIEFTINGEDRSADVPPHITLLRFIRESMGLTGTKEGCGNGECGACTVIMDGEPVRSCLVLAAEINGKEILTIEGLAKDGKLHPIQQAFIDAGAVQCGFCTPGFIMAVYAFLLRHPEPSKEQAAEALKGHLCRCTGYESIFNAVGMIVDNARKMEVA